MRVVILTVESLEDRFRVGIIVRRRGGREMFVFGDVGGEIKAGR